MQWSTNLLWELWSSSLESITLNIRLVLVHWHLLLNVRSLLVFRYWAWRLIFAAFWLIHVRLVISPFQYLCHPHILVIELFVTESIRIITHRWHYLSLSLLLPKIHWIQWVLLLLLIVKWLWCCGSMVVVCVLWLCSHVIVLNRRWFSTLVSLSWS
jgi:hypothetical protein